MPANIFLLLSHQMDTHANVDYQTINFHGHCALMEEDNDSHREASIHKHLPVASDHFGWGKSFAQDCKPGGGSDLGCCHLRKPRFAPQTKPSVRNPQNEYKL
jgi:hypothetical protein